MSTRQKPNPDPGIINYLATNVEQQADPMTKRAHMAVLLRFLSFFTKFEGKVSDPIKLYEEKLGELEHQRGGSNATPRGSTSGSDEELMQVKSVLETLKKTNEASARMRIQPWLINAVANLLPLDEDMEDDEEDPIGDDPVVPVLSGGIELPDRLFIVPEMAVAYQELDLDDGRKALVRGAIDWVTVRIPGNKASLALEDKTFDREICIIEAKAAEINTRAVLTQALAEAAIVCEYQK
ncbi:hypothetical protein FRC00_004525 [Tulasnella sp. 408]|nr:hypothetical protein FRC00_004525 [Tulasnella sp. 408]